MTANELDKAVMELVHTYDVYSIMPKMELVGTGQKMEVLNTSGQSNLYYQWLACLVKLVKPKQVVELGAAAGISTTMILSELPKDSKLFSVDIDPQSWRWMNTSYPQLSKILGDDLNFEIYPKDFVLEDTNILFIDSLHTKDQLQKEVDLYLPKLKKGTIVIFDDIRMDGLWDVWQSLDHDKCETTNPNHYSGFGHLII